MALKGQKKAFDTGALCGLRFDTPTAPRKSPRASLTGGSAQVSDQPVAPVTPSPRPQSLTLPFQNRDRASHLISDEEFDRIMRQSELDNPVPRLTSGIPSHLSGLGIRRSASTVKNSRTSFFGQRPRPASANFSDTIQATANHAQDVFVRPAFPRDPTLTALPRPPTKNDMAIYPSQRNINPVAASSGHIDTIHDGTAPTTNPRSQTPVVHPPLGLNNDGLEDFRGHKRKFSLTLAAANMVESVKKRIKRADSPAPPGMRISSPMLFSPPTNRDSQRTTTPYTFPSSPVVHPNNDPNFMTQVSTNSDAISSDDADVDTDHNVTPAPTSTKTPISSAKSVMKQTWSLTKDTAREALDIVIPLSRIINRPKEPTFVEVISTNSSRRTTPSIIHPDNPTPASGNTINTSAYFASADSSPFFNYPITAAAAAPPRPKPWQTAPREILGGEIERLENRTMELVARNEGYTREIEYLRARVGQLEASEGGTVRRRGEGLGGGRSEGAGEMEMDKVMDVDMDDKRKTWLTYHSDDEKDGGDE